MFGSSVTKSGRGQSPAAFPGLFCNRSSGYVPSPSLALATLLCFQAHPTFTQTPDYLWAQAPAGASDETAQAVAVDPNGNVLITGFFSGTCSFGPTNLSSAGQEDIFVAKYDPLGNLLWVRQAGGSSYDEGRGIATDTQGNIFVTGLFQGTANFGAVQVASSGWSDVFIAKYAPNGNLLWVRAAGGKDYDEGHAIAVDAQGNAYLTGFFDATAAFGAIPLPNTTASDNMFVAKYSPSGDFLWARQAGGSLDDQGNAIALDASTNVYVAGSFADTALFGATTLTALGTNAATDAFLAKYDSNGNLLWVRQAGGAGDDAANAVAADASGNIWLGGRFFTPAIFEATNLVGNGADIFLARYTSAGALQWVRRAGGNNAIYGDSGLALALDPQGYGILAGYFSGSSSFSTNLLATLGFDDAFCAKYDPNGNVRWVRRLGGNNLDVAYGVASDQRGNAFLTGFFASTTVAVDGLALTNRGGRDIFLAKFGLNIVPAISTAVSSNSLVLTWPMVAADYALEATGNLPAANWESLPWATNQVGLTRTVTFPFSDPRRFFRLRKL